MVDRAGKEAPATEARAGNDKAARAARALAMARAGAEEDLAATEAEGKVGKKRMAEFERDHSESLEKVRARIDNQKDKCHNGCSGVVRSSNNTREAWVWESTSQLLADAVFELRGDTNDIVFKISGSTRNNCMTVGPVMQHGIDSDLGSEQTHTISFKKISDGMAYLGIVPDTVPCDKDPMSSCKCELYEECDEDVGWFMDMNTGDIHGHQKYYCKYISGYDGPGPVRCGEVLTMQLVQGHLKFWKNGKVHGREFDHGVAGRLRWALCAAGGGFQIVPNPPDLEPWKVWFPKGFVMPKPYADY